MVVLGMMSGTSVDGIDVSLVRISGAPPNLQIKLLNHTAISFPAAVRKEILRVAEQTPITSGELSQLHFRLGHIYADAALAACKKFRVSVNKIDLIGNHGQTIFHQGKAVPYLGAQTASTLQIGEGVIIAARTGVTTISDFRPADMALGGNGACFSTSNRRIVFKRLMPCSRKVPRGLSICHSLRSMPPPASAE